MAEHSTSVPFLDSTGQASPLNFRKLSALARVRRSSTSVASTPWQKRADNGFWSMPGGSRRPWRIGGTGSAPGSVGGNRAAGACGASGRGLFLTHATI